MVGKALVLVTLQAVAAVVIAAERSPEVPYPEGYRHGTFLHSSMVEPTFSAFSRKPCEKPCTAGIFYFYANGRAMEGLRTGAYPDGAILTEEMLEWLGNPNGSGKEGHRVMVGVMEKDSRRYNATGGWGFAVFDEGSKTDVLDEKTRATCYQCHLSRRKDNGYVFTEYHER